MRVLNRNLSKELDRVANDNFGISSIHLMEIAGKVSADIIDKDFSSKNQRKAIIICGPGNNGGDGFVIARLLFIYGWTVDVFILSEFDKYKDAAYENLKILLNCNENSKDKIKVHISYDSKQIIDTISQLNPNLIVDAIFGVGLTRPIEGFISDIIEYINNSKIAPIYSIDIPSGISADTGEILGVAIKAEKTITFSNPKVGHLIYPGKSYTGELIIKEIGIPKDSINEKKPNLFTFTSLSEIKPYLKTREKDTHKGDYGRVLVLGGSKTYIGALSLATSASIKTGTGLTYAAYKENLKHQFSSSLPDECIHLPLPTDDKGLFSDITLNALINLPINKNLILLAGPGIGRDKDVINFIKQIYLNWDGVMVFDADALFAIHEIINEFKHKAKLVLTPHIGEMSYLTGLGVDLIKKNLVEIANNYAHTWNCTIVLKSASTIIASEDDNIYINNFGNPGMAKGGSGDVLSGTIASFLAQGYEPFNASLLGSTIHSIAGDLAAKVKTEWSLTPTDIIDYIPKAFKTISS